MDWTQDNYTELITKMIGKAKLTLRISTNAFDEEIKDIIMAGYDDLTIAGVLTVDQAESPLAVRAVMTYVRCHFGNPEDPVRLKQAYDEQKAQLRTATGYTDWGDDEEES